LRWLLLKDLQILRRSPFLVVLLVAYPVIIALLIGLALSRAPEKPKVAFLNEVAPSATSFQLGTQRLDASRYANELFKSIQPVRVHTRKQAIDAVKSGEVLAALIVPADIVDRLQGAINLQGGPPPTLQVLYNADDPVKNQYVLSAIKSRLADANRALSDKLTQIASGYLDILLHGGSFSLLGQRFEVLGLQRSQRIIDASLGTLPPRSRAALAQVSSFARLAIANLDLSKPVLSSISSPVKVDSRSISGRSAPLDAFAVAVAVAISLLFVTVLLAAGMLALEREEHAFGRLVRGLVSRWTLLGEKALLSAACAFAVSLVMLCGIGLFVHLDWQRFPLWVAALAVGALGFGALGTAIGALAREVRVASLLAFLLALPIAFLALVPSGAVSTGLYDVIRVVSALFPFKPALQGLDAAINDTTPALPGPLVHLALLAAAYFAIARAALARFA
jgi:ABC-type transport system involved in cytochrome c biogenesis permease component